MPEVEAPAHQPKLVVLGLGLIALLDTREKWKMRSSFDYRMIARQFLCKVGAHLRKKNTRAIHLLLTPRDNYIMHTLSDTRFGLTITAILILINFWLILHCLHRDPEDRALHSARVRPPGQSPQQPPFALLATSALSWAALDSAHGFGVATELTAAEDAITPSLQDESTFFCPVLEGVCLFFLEAGLHIHYPYILSEGFKQAAYWKIIKYRRRRGASHLMA